MSNMISIEADVLKALFAPNASFFQLRDAKHAARQSWELWYAASLEPAMTTNQKIDGELRELLERVLSYAWFPSGDVSVFDLRLIDREQLRALLDAKPKDYPPCDYCGIVPSYHPWHGSGALAGVENPHIHACNECRRLLPAIQPQGESPQEDRETLIEYGRSSALEEASTLCARMAYAAYYPPGTRFKAFTPKAQRALGDLLIKAANEIASLPGGPYERFKARQAKKAEPGKS